MFLRRLLIVLCLLPPVTAAHAQSTKTTVVSNINVDFADNTAGAITAALLRSVTTEMVSSYVDWLTCTTQGGIAYWNASAAPTCLISGTAGQILTTYPTPAWESLANKITAGTAILVTGTITPTIAVSPNAVLDSFGTTQGGVIYRGSTGWAFLSPGTSGQVFTTGGTGANPSFTSVAGTGTVQSVTCGTGLTCSSNPITVSGTLTPTFATGDQFMANNVTGVVEVGTPWQAAQLITLTAAPVITPNFATGINFAVVVTGNTIIGNPLNQKSGQTGCFYLTQSGTTTGTVAYYNNWFFSGGTSPTASTGINQQDALCYQVRSISAVVGSMLTNIRQTVP